MIPQPDGWTFDAKVLTVIDNGTVAMVAAWDRKLSDDEALLFEAHCAAYYGLAVPDPAAVRAARGRVWLRTLRERVAAARASDDWGVARPLP